MSQTNKINLVKKDIVDPGEYDQSYYDLARKKQFLSYK